VPRTLSLAGTWGIAGFLSQLMTSIVVVVLVGYSALLAYFAPLMSQDGPNRLARGVVIADLIIRHDQEFGQVFQYHL
jgi:hypothetical protein